MKKNKPIILFLFFFTNLFSPFSEEIMPENNIIIYVSAYSDKDDKDMKLLSCEDTNILYKALMTMEYIGIRKIRTPYFITLYNNGNEISYKTNGEYFAAIGSDIYFKTKENMKYLLE